MNVIRKHTNDFTIVTGFDLANRQAFYDNVGQRQCISWIYLISGNLSIKYNKDGYDGSYNLDEGTLADLTPIEGLATEWTSGKVGCSWIAFIPADLTIKYQFDVKTFEESTNIDAIDCDRFLFIIDNAVIYDGNVINEKSYLNIPAGKSCTITSKKSNSTIAIVTKSNI